MMHEPASFPCCGAFAAGRCSSSDEHQLYSARLPCHLVRFGVTVWAAGYAQAVS